jgi:hypothetical protein
MTRSLEVLDQSGDIREIAEAAGAHDAGHSRRDLLKRAGIGGAGIVGGGAALGFLSPLEAFAAGGKATGPYSHHRSAKNDVRIGNFALTLEYLEAAFYAQAVKNGGLTDPDIIHFAKTVASHEAKHVKELKAVLGKHAVSSPTVDFGTAVTDQTTFLKTAAVLEPVGTAAYAGAGPYIKNLNILKAALSIHSVEANHAAWAAALLNLKDLDDGIQPAPHANNPAYGYKKVLALVGATGFVTGNLHP